MRESEEVCEKDRARARGREEGREGRGEEESERGRGGGSVRRDSFNFSQTILTD